MEFQEVISHRRMVRHFTTDPLDPDVAERIVAAGLRAPSAGYSQGYALIVLDSQEDLDRLWATHTPSEAGWSPEVRAGIVKAPLVIALLASKDVYLDRYAEPDKGWTDRDETRWPVPYWFVDAGAVAVLLLLACVDEGLGALLFGIVPADIPRFRATFGVPDSYDVVGCVAVGHEDPAAPRRDLSARRRDRSELVHRGRW
ncbi:MAG: nitroreductase family protein [Acidimicrobiales bacterium]|jgi:nitroreductase